MNTVIISGRLTREPVIRETAGTTGNKVAQYTLAVDRRRRRDGEASEQTADFISCVAFGHGAEFAEKYLHKGTLIGITGRLRSGQYTGRAGNTVYTTDVVVDSHEFLGPKQAQTQNSGDGTTPAPAVTPTSDAAGTNTAAAGASTADDEWNTAENADIPFEYV